MTTTEALTAMPTDPEALAYLILLAVLITAWLIGQIVTGLTPVWQVRRERTRRVAAEERAARAEDRAAAAEAELRKAQQIQARHLSRQTFAVPLPQPSPAVKAETQTLVLTDLDAT